MLLGRLEFNQSSRQIVAISGDLAEPGYSLVDVSEEQCQALDNPDLRLAPLPSGPLSLEPVGVGDRLPEAGPSCLEADFGISQSSYRRSGDYQTYYHPLVEEEFAGKVALRWRNPPVQTVAVFLYLATVLYLYIWYFRGSQELDQHQSTKLRPWRSLIPLGHYHFHYRYSWAASVVTGSPHCAGWVGFWFWRPISYWWLVWCGFSSRVRTSLP